MDDTRLLHIAAASAGLALIVILTIPALKQLWSKAKVPHRQGYREVVPGLFESIDGQATEQSVEGFTDWGSRVASWISVILGFGASITAATLLTVNSNSPLGTQGSWWKVFNTWADVPCFALLCIQCASLPTKSQYDTRFRLAILGFFSAAISLLSIGVRFGFDTVHTLNTHGDSLALGIAVCRLLELLTALAVALAFASFPHRPDVYHKGALVDQQHAVSLLSRFAFSWNKLVFDISRERKLDQEDLPAMDGNTRSSNVTARFRLKNTKGRLWWQIMSSFWVPLAVQWTLTLIQAGLALFPQYVLYNFLEGLEVPPELRRGDPKLWGWVVGLASSLCLQIWVSNAQRWNTASRLEAPVLSLVQSLVFQKALNQDEAAEPGQKEEEKSDDKEAPKDTDEKKPKSDVRQAVVNHIKLDSTRMNIFCTYNAWFPLATFKLILAGSYLIHLLGWLPVVAGLGSAVLVLPLSHLMSKRYGAIQFSLMKYRDAKTHTLTEALHGMRQIKYSALEDVYEKKILETRNAELDQYWKVTRWMCYLNAVISSGPLLLSCVSLSMYAYATDHIKASTIFASLGLFDQLDEAIGLLPIIQVYLVEAWTSCVRLEKYLNKVDKADVSLPSDNIVFENVTVRWPKVEDADEVVETPPNEEEARSVLRDVTLDFPNGELSVIAGKTGAGKSLLLAAILGEVKLLSGTIRIPSPPPASVIEAEEVPESEWILPTLTSFVSQTPWIESGTVKENIIFGAPFNDARYKKVLRTCALDKDVELLIDGDETEVGPKGVTLSGGQRWRIALARALYSRAGILILDDVLSAVDAHVGRTIVDEALTGELAEGRTRILATHHAEMCLPRASYLVRLRNGRLEKAEQVSHADDETASGSAGESSTAASTSDATAVDTDNGAEPSKTADENGKKAKKTSSDEEDREHGRVKMHVYKAYIKASNSWLLWGIALVLLLTARGIGVFRTWSLKELSESYSTEALFHRMFTQVSDAQNFLRQSIVHEEAYRRSANFWISAYIIFSVLGVAIIIIFRVAIFFIGLRASRLLFEQMTNTVLHTPLRWADTMPMGRILNRFTTDTFWVDRRLAGDLAALLSNLFMMGVIISTSVAISPYVLVFGVVLLFLYTRIATAYIAVAREVKRINSVAHSPIYDQFSSVLSGLSTIRAFQRTDFYMNRMYELIDNGAKSTWSLQLLSRWMSFRMGMLGVVFVTVVAISILLGSIDASLAGFALVFALRYTGALTSLLTNMTSIELGFNAAERILEFIETDTEPQGGDDAPAAWPSEGKIEVDNLTVGYSEELPAVLKEITFDVKPGERIGIIGRTGAGKSTLAAVLFRLLEARQGSVHIDGIDISKIKLSQLRSRLAIIPQDPFLFAGTLRSNLDLEGSIDDYDLQIVLRRVHLVDPETGDPQRPSAYPPVDTTLAALEPTPIEPLTDGLEPNSSPNTESTTVPVTSDADQPPLLTIEETTTDQDTGYTTAFTNLSTPISTGGGNLSQGQRQLVCLARALLTRPKIVVLDEATSAVDRGTDGAIQESLRKEFAAGGCTVLVIAHRLSTVADFDRLLVLNEGRVAEFGTPAELLKRGMELDQKREAGEEGESESAAGGSGAFWELVQRSAEKDKLMEMILGGKEAVRSP